jgi:hypothetical protein
MFVSRLGATVSGEVDELVECDGVEDPIERDLAFTRSSE